MRLEALTIQQALARQQVESVLVSERVRAVEEHPGVALILEATGEYIAYLEGGLARITVPREPNHSVSMIVRTILQDVGAPFRTVAVRDGLRITKAGFFIGKVAHPGDVIEAFRDYNAPHWSLQVEEAS